MSQDKGATPKKSGFSLIIGNLARFVVLFYIGNYLFGYLGIFAVLAYMGMKVWNYIGGWPEAYYRIAGIDYLQSYMITPIGKVQRTLYKLADVKMHSPAMIRWNGGDYVIDRAEIRNDKGAPAYLHRWDDSRQIPTDRDDETGNWMPKCDPKLIAEGYDDDVYEQLNSLGKKPPSIIRSPAFLLMMLIMLGLVGLNIYYTITYGYNLNCALHTKVC